ncbi:ATP-binding protein [Aequorivita antarctica]|uniref:ATP-binding protein n=1 Tax=Aequorivita antarctica TaxID=153266 RepID=A0A5C6YXN3_9FLAO|nr:ATP-binding protein [Aequorivita antarctica]TXD72355.1 ATP-binding protein [Aequorivita antarctica]SRX74498.1 hypothetical protein AEQU3_01477 [Aequorivita antarctica]
MKKYPFKFLDSYNREDRGIFFGRDEEIAALYEMVFQSSIILVYGASGTGKTSLINCGLAGKFQPHDWLALMVRRENNINKSLEKVLNDAGGKISSLTEEFNWSDEWSDDVKKTAPQLTPIGKSIKAIYQKSFRPVYLIFDQFEELFILGSASEQELFIQTVKDILQSEQPVKMIFAIREEYLGHLFEFERAVPQLLQKKLRIEPMNLEKVKQVIIGAAEHEDSNISIKQGESDQVAEGIFDKIKGNEKSRTIQLPFLQVFLDKFYLKITEDKKRKAEAEFNVQALNEMGEIGDILVNFLEEQVSSISQKLKGKYPSLNVDRTWAILSPFSTLEGTKEPINKEELYERLPDYDTGLIDDVVDAFTNSRILRYNEGADMFEIAHDALAKPIAEKRSVEETALLEIKRLIESQVAVKEEAREYFTEKQLVFIEPYVEKFNVGEEEQKWITKSEEFNKQTHNKELVKTRKRLRTLYSLLGGAMIALVVAVVSYFNSKESEDIATKALDQSNTEQQARTKAQSAKDAYEFKSLESRANIILEVNGCPSAIVKKMDSLLALHSNNLQWQKKIDSIKIVQKQKNCK